MSWLESKKTGTLLTWLVGILFIILLNQVSSIYYSRIDLTEEKRYSIKPATKELLNNLDDNVYIEVYLEGELNSGFRRLQKSVKEILEEFEIYSNYRVRFNFIDPSSALSSRARNEFMTNLASKGITPTNVIDNRDGERSEKIIFPGAVISYGEAEKGVMLLSGSRGEDQLNSSIENIEFNLASAIYQLTNIGRKKVGFINGHGELNGEQILSFQNSLYNFYDIEEVDLSSQSLAGIDLAVIVKPIRPWDELEKYKLDQFIMSGGKALVLLDLVDANMDSASNEYNTSFPYESGLEDVLFRYGVRVNTNLVQDNNAALYPIVIGSSGNQPRIMQLPWPFFPIVNRFSSHPISKNLDGVLLQFASSIDTVKADGIIKTPLLFTSDFSRTVTAPTAVSINDLRQNLKPEDLNQSNIPMAYLLEGAFTSVYKNRFLPEGVYKQDFVEVGVESKVLVIGDGDFATNDVDPEGNVQELGTYRKIPGMKYANKEFLLNAVSYMLEEDGIITARNKEIKIRPLNKVTINREKSYWQSLNLVLPVLLTIALGIILHFFRRSKYAKTKA